MKIQNKNKWDLIKLKTFWRVKYKSFLFKIFPCSENPFHPIVYTLTRSSTHSTMTDFLHLQAHCNDRMFSVIFLIEVKLVYNIVWVSCVNVMIWCMCSLWRVITRFWLPCISLTWCPAVVQLLSHVRLFATPWTAAHQASMSFTISQSLLRLMSIESLMPSNYLILCHHLLLMPSIFPSIRVFSSESALHIRSPKYWSFSISPSNEYSGIISFRTDLIDLLSLKSLIQHHSLKASILWCSAFFMVQVSYPYITGKTIALTIEIFVSKVMCLLFNTLSLS